MIKPFARSPRTPAAAVGLGLTVMLLLVSAPAQGQQTPASPSEPAGPSSSAESLESLLKSYQIDVEDGRKVVELSLSQALELALSRSINLQAVRMGETISQSQIVAARERNNPVLTHDLSYGRSISAFPSFGGGSRTDALTYQATLSKKLSNGVEVAGIFTEEHQDVTGFEISSSGQASNFGGSTQLETSALTGQVTIPFFQDYGDVNDIPIRLAEVGLQSSLNNTRLSRRDLMRLVASTYWDLVGVRERIRVQGEAVKLSEQLLKDNRARLEAGVLSPADVKVSETQLAQDRQNLLSSRVDQRRIEDQVRAALNLGEVDYGLKPVERPTLRQGPFDFNALLLKVYANDPTLANLQAQLEQNRYQTDAALNQDKTNLDLALKYTLNGYGKDTADATGNLDQTKLHGYGATLTWTVPLFDTTTRETIAQRRLERAQIELRVANARSDLSVQTQAARRLLQLAEEEVRTARTTVSLQKELLQNEIERFKLGESTSFQVAQVQQDFLGAQQSEIFARINYEKEFLEILLLTGDIYSQYGLPQDRNP